MVFVLNDALCTKPPPLIECCGEMRSVFMECLSGKGGGASQQLLHTFAPCLSKHVSNVC